MPAPVSVTHNKAEQRYEVTIDGETAFSEYEMRDGTIVFLHTEVPKAFEGRGIASALAKAALDDARQAHLRVVPLCPFVRAYIRRHPEYRDLVDHASRKQG